MAQLIENKELLGESPFIHWYWDLGPLFNDLSCAGCHNTPSAGGMGVSPDTFILRVARIEGGVFDPLAGHGGPVARQRLITEFGFPCGLPTGTPPRANATSGRSALTLRGTSLIDSIQLSEILAEQQALLEFLGCI